MHGLRAFVLTLMLAGGIAPARAALIFDFSFSNTTGNVAGTVTGQILGLTDNTTSEAATDIEITSYPSALTGLPPAPFSIMAYATSLSQPITSNVFTVAAGQVTAASFQVGSGFFDLNIAGTYSELFNSYPANYLQNQGGFGAITFSEAPEVPVPEPASAALLLSGLFGLRMIRRRNS